MSRWGELIRHMEDDPTCLCGCQDEETDVTRSVEIPEEAVDAALDVVMDDGHNGLDCRPDRNLAVTVRAALEAALPYLTPAASRERMIEVLGGSELAAATVDHVLESGVLAAPAVPQPVDREALVKVIAGPYDNWLTRHQAEVTADRVLAVLAGEQEQVESQQ